MIWKLHLLIASVYFLSILHRSFTNGQRFTSTDDYADSPVVEAARKEFMNYQNDKYQLKIGKKKLVDEKKVDKIVKMTEVIRLNVGGEIMMTTRKSLTSVSTSVLAKLFNGRWEERMYYDIDTNIFLDFNPALFRHLLEQLRQFRRNPSSHFIPPPSSSPFAVQSFNRILKKLGLSRTQLSSNEMVVMNVGGHLVMTRQKTLNSSQSTALLLHPSQKRIIGDMMANGLFIDADPWLFRYLLGQLREQKTSKPLYFRLPSSEKMKSMNRMLKHFGLNRPEDCAAIYLKENTTRGQPPISGVYEIWPREDKSIKVLCDMSTDGGGWTVFQKRGDFTPQEDFYRTWLEYKRGFGDLQRQFWLGNDFLSMLTNQDSYRLRVDLEDFDGEKRFAEYETIRVSNETDKYRLSLGPYLKGTAGDSLKGHSGTQFSTKDQDNDLYSESCAVQYNGAWWYTACHSSNLNGPYLRGNHPTIYAKSVVWLSFRGYHYSLKATEMKLRPKWFKP